MSNQNGPLKRKDGSECPKCQVVFFEKLSKCDKCGGSTNPATFYSRFIRERLAFIVSVALICGTGAFFEGEDNETILKVLLGTTFAMWITYRVGKFWFGFSGFIERFPEEAVPPRAHLTFSWGRYFSEIFRIMGILILVFVFAGLYAVIKRVFFE